VSRGSAHPLADFYGGQRFALWGKRPQTQTTKIELCNYLQGARKLNDKTPAITPTGFLIKPGTKSHISRGQETHPSQDEGRPNKQLTN